MCCALVQNAVSQFGEGRGQRSIQTKRIAGANVVDNQNEEYTDRGPKIYI
jgi:hypothetical protein